VQEQANVSLEGLWVVAGHVEPYMWMVVEVEDLGLGVVVEAVELYL